MRRFEERKKNISTPVGLKKKEERYGEDISPLINANNSLPYLYDSMVQGPT
jgi:hypothetical protein